MSAEAGIWLPQTAIEPKFRTIPIKSHSKTPSESPYTLRHRQIRHLRRDSIERGIDEVDAQNTDGLLLEDIGRIAHIDVQ